MSRTSTGLTVFPLVLQPQVVLLAQPAVQADRQVSANGVVAAGDVDRRAAAAVAIADLGKSISRKLKCGKGCVKTRPFLFLKINFHDIKKKFRFPRDLRHLGIDMVREPSGCGPNAGHAGRRLSISDRRNCFITRDFPSQAGLSTRTSACREPDPQRHHDRVSIGARLMGAGTRFARNDRGFVCLYAPHRGILR